MTNIVRNTMLALALLSGAALISTPVLAAPHERGSSWNKNAHNDSYSRHNGYHRGYNRNPGYTYNGPDSYYGSRYGYGSRDYEANPGLSITIR
jgi:hypothetical protein